LRGPAEEERRELAARKGAANCEAVDKSGLVCGSIGPEKRILKLKLDCPSYLPPALGEKKITLCYISGNLLSC
jgi:hypothetical protein